MPSDQTTGESELISGSPIVLETALLLKKLSYLERFEIESALNFRCWRIRDRQDGGKALLHNVTGLQATVTALQRAGLLLESGEQDGLQFALTPDREELIDLGAWKYAPVQELGEFTRMFAAAPSAAAPDVSAPPPLNPPVSSNAPKSSLGEFTSVFLSAGVASKPDISKHPDDHAAAAQAPEVGAPASAAAPVSGSAPTPKSGVGEFTSIFVSAAASKPDVAKHSDDHPTSQIPLNPDDIATVQMAVPGFRSPAAPRSPIASEPDSLLEKRWTGRAPIVPAQKPGEAASTLSTPSAAEPDSSSGEFTQLFAKPDDVSSPARQANLSGATTIFPISEPPRTEPQKDTGAGEFTQFFRASTPKPSPAPPQQRSTPEPGGFTSLFQAPNPVSASASSRPSPNPSPSPAASPVGGLTAMFAAPSGNSDAQRGPAGTPPPTPPQPSPDFDKFFASPLASNQESMEARLHSDQPVAPERPMVQEPGQFTRLFGRDEIDAAIGRDPQPVRSPDAGAAAPAGTSLFPALPMEKEIASRAAASRETPAEPMSGPSEFTRVFQRPSESAKAAPAPGATAPAAIEQAKAAKGRMGKVLKIVLAVVATIVAALVAFFLVYKKHH
jgi:hypothetical protein